MRVWMVVNGLVLVGLAAWILEPSATAPAPEGRSGPPLPATPQVTTSATASPTPSPAPALPTKTDVLDVPGLRFGISAPDVPWSGRELGRLTDAADASPTMIQFFVNWTEEYPAEAVELSYRRSALPVLSWEPWAGLAQGTSQPDYSLRRIIDGFFDDYLEEFATAVRDHELPLVIRFAHEMNGTWYPWSEQLSGNQFGEFVPAWQHVHDIFESVGAGNVIWLWSPNILRPVPEISLQALYPGDDYVDWVGIVGYAVEESTAGAVFDPTLDTLRQFTDKPVVITETGAQPGPNKVPWIEDFFSWISQQPELIGFIWFEYDAAQGGNADWRFTASPETIEAFRDGLTRVDLADPLATGPLPR